MENIFILFCSEDPFDEVDVDAEILGNPTKVISVCVPLWVKLICCLQCSLFILLYIFTYNDVKCGGINEI